MTTTAGRSRCSAFAFTSLAGLAFGCLATASSRPEGPVSVEAPNSAAEPVSTVVANVDLTAKAGRTGTPGTPTDPGAVATAVLSLSAAEVSDRELQALEAAVPQLSRRVLLLLAESAVANPRDARVGLLYGELAYIHAISDEPEEARRFALAARQAGATGRAQAVVSAILDAELADLMPADPVIGLVLPVTGSPSNREYARRFMEGVEVAAARARRSGLRVEFLVEDNRGTRAGSERGVSALVSSGAEVILGPLDEGNLEYAVRAAPGRVAFLSPTAARVPFGRRGTYSLGAGDRGAGRTLARAVHRAGCEEAVIVHPLSPGELLEAGAFENEFIMSGGTVRRRLQYEPGTTTFEVEFRTVENLRPQVLVFASPPADVQLLAPQFAFYGLDTLGIQVAGTAPWTAPSVLESVARRHTDSVISVTARDPEAFLDPAASFVAAYERHFRRTLLSPVPAVGYDLFRMAMAAYGDGVRTSRGTVASLERLDGFRGATGTYSYVDGRLEREFYPVRIIGGELRPVDSATAMPPDSIGIRPDTLPAACR